MKRRRLPLTLLVLVILAATAAGIGESMRYESVIRPGYNEAIAYVVSTFASAFDIDFQDGFYPCKFSNDLVHHEPELRAIAMYVIRHGDTYFVDHGKVYVDFDKEADMDDDMVRSAMIHMAGNHDYHAFYKLEQNYVIFNTFGSRRGHEQGLCYSIYGSVPGMTKSKRLSTNWCYFEDFR